jgi:hypothetical protein
MGKANIGATVAKQTPAADTVVRERAVNEGLVTLQRSRLAKECAKLDPAEEQALADEVYAAEAKPPRY